MARRNEKRGKSGRGGSSGEEEVRLHKRLARLGLASRREAERWIAAGRVEVNGEVVSRPGTKVGPGDRIAVDGRDVGSSPPNLTIALNKPLRVVCTARDPEGRETIYDLLPDGMPHLAYVGRLDVMTEGLLLMTTDGDLARGLTLPSAGIPRVYEAKIRGHLSKRDRERLQAGIPLDGRTTLPTALERLPSQSKHDWWHVTLFEGRNRQVRRLFEAVGHPVVKLRRVSFAGITLEGLKVGDHRVLSPQEEAELRKAAGMAAED